MANVEEAKKAYEEAYALVAEGSSLYEKHVAYTTALDAYNAFVKVEEEAKKQVSPQKNNVTTITADTTMSDAEIKQAVGTQTIVATDYATSKSADTSDPFELGFMAFALLESIALASYSIVKVHLRKGEWIFWNSAMLRK